MNHKKIAMLANVSASTVSKALSGSGEVSKETAEKIRQIAIEVGYFKEKNKRKRDYANNGAYMIAVIVPEIMGFHYATIVTCIKNEVEAKGGCVAVYISDFDRQKATKILQEIILHGGADGVIMFSYPDLPVKPNIPIVLCCAKENGDYDTISYDVSAMLRDAVGYLVGLGHREIGFVGEPLTIGASVVFEQVIKEMGLPFREEYRYIMEDRFENIGHLAAGRLLAQTQRPSAVIAAYDEIAVGLIAALTQTGMKIPGELSVMGINNIPTAAHIPIPLTSMDTFSAAQYRTAVAVLFDKIKNDNPAVRHITISHKIIVRGTTGRISEYTNDK